MSTPPGKPVDPNAFMSRERGEPDPSETANQPLRSPYAPKPAHERAAREPQPAAGDHDPLRSPYAPKSARTPLSRQSGFAAGSVAQEQPAPLAPEQPRARTVPGGERHAFSAADRRGAEIDGPRLCPDDGPGGGHDPAAPFLGEQAPPVQPPATPLEARGGEHPQASLQPADPVGSRRHERPAARRADEIMSEVDLERLEASLRWLRRQEAATRLSRDGHPFGEPTLVPHATPASRQGGDRFGETHRSPLSLEPQRLPPPPLKSRGDNLRGPLRILIASCIAAPFLYYFFATGSAPPETPASSPRMASVESLVVAPPPSNAIPAREAAPAAVPAGEPTPPAGDDTTLRTVETPPAAQAPEREAVAMLQPQAPGPEAAPAGHALRPLDPDEIKLLIKQGEQFVATGDLVTARTVLQRAAQAGDATAAVALGATYDPTVLARLGVIGMGGADVEQARRWYHQAESLGSAEATKQLRVLAGR
jgi:hypothetical protein